MGKIQTNRKKKMDLRNSPRGERSENIGGDSKYITMYSREAAMKLQKSGEEPSVGLLEAFWSEERLVEGNGPSRGSWLRSVAEAQRWSAMREIWDFSQESEYVPGPISDTYQQSRFISSCNCPQRSMHISCAF